MTDRIMAVKIAKDVLKYIRANKIIVKNRLYFSVKGKDNSSTYTDQIYRDALYNYNKNTQAQKYFSKEKEPCGVCALGAVLYATFMKVNNLKCGDLLKMTDCPHSFSTEGFQFLKPYFDSYDLEQLEYCFELGKVGILYNNCGRADELESYIYTANMGKMLPHERLRFLMLNFIRNKGRFVIPKYVKVNSNN